MSDSHIRSVVKGISWRVSATLMTIVISFVITGKVDVALSIGTIEFALKILWFYIHERMWIVIKWGRIKQG
ncbi:MAG: DUF2061 domain-containing protein [Candidatus Dojkabacteria bacterium]